MRTVTFSVIDPITGKYPNLEMIARTEEWACRIMPMDAGEFHLAEDGALVLIDDCGNFGYPPAGRFEIIDICINDIAEE
ncbi:MAG TPA: hypothetical protein PKV44_05340 [Bacillota bacterium]|nr:hypothetical protein [Bacillota bacterium]